MLRPLLLALAASVALTGCTAVGALNRASEPLDVYELRAPADLPVARGRPQAIDFVVEVPSASGVVDTDRILVRPTPAQVQYLPDARWSENAPVMVQTALVEGLERIGAFRFVGRRPLAASSDVALVSNMTEFHAEVAPEGGGALVRISLVARLVREADASVVARRTFSGVATVPDTSTAAILEGYSTASQQVLDQMLTWILTERRVAVGPS